MKLLHLIGDLVTWSGYVSFLRASKIILEIFYDKTKAVLGISIVVRFAILSEECALILNFDSSQ